MNTGRRAAPVAAAARRRSTRALVDEGGWRRRPLAGPRPTLRARTVAAQIRIRGREVFVVFGGFAPDLQAALGSLPARRRRGARSTPRTDDLAPAARRPVRAAPAPPAPPARRRAAAPRPARGGRRRRPSSAGPTDADPGRVRRRPRRPAGAGQAAGRARHDAAGGARARSRAEARAPPKRARPPTAPSPRAPLVLRAGSSRSAASAASRPTGCRDDYLDGPVPVFDAGERAVPPRVRTGRRAAAGGNQKARSPAVVHFDGVQEEDVGGFRGSFTRPGGSVCVGRLYGRGAVGALVAAGWCVGTLSGPWRRAAPSPAPSTRACRGVAMGASPLTRSQEPAPET